MNSIEHWMRWLPKEDVVGRFYLDSFCSIDKKLILHVLNESETVKVELLFDRGVDAYRYTNESFCFTIFGDLTKKYGANFYAGWSFFKITDSDYLDMISEQFFGNNVERLESTHFVFMGDDEVIDILSRDEPTVTITMLKK